MAANDAPVAAPTRLLRGGRVTTAAIYTLVLVALLALGLASLAPVARWLAETLGWDTAVSQALLAVGLATLAVPLARRVGPRVERWFLPERHALESGASQLAEDLADCRTPAEVFDLLVERVPVLLRPERFQLLVREAERLVRWRSETGEDAFPIPPEEALPSGAIDVRGPRAVDTALDAFARAAAPGAAVLVPIRVGAELGALLALGAKRSGDRYRPSDLDLLGALAERAAGELLRIRDARVIERERASAAELARLEGEARAALLAKSRYLAAASHDLRQPLHALGLFAAGLDRDIPEPALRAQVTAIQRETLDLQETMGALLEVARIDAGAVAPEISDVALLPLLEEMALRHRAEAGERGVEIRIEAGPQAARSDPQLLLQLLEPLVVNAIRHGGPGIARVHVAEQDGEQLVIEVEDEGRGIPETDQEMIFEEFVRRGPEPEGLGLGLPIAQKLARLLGHELELESQPGRGTRVRVRLPLGSADVLPASPATPVDLAGRSFVVVDDDLTILAGMKRTLEDWGARVMLASSGEEASESLADGRFAPDAIISDWSLSERETGFDAIGRIRRTLGRNLPALIISGDASAEHRAAIRATELPLLTKPVAPARLRAMLRELLRED